MWTWNPVVTTVKAGFCVMDGRGIERQHVVLRVDGKENFTRIFPVIPDSITLHQGRRDGTLHSVRVKASSPPD